MAKSSQILICPIPHLELFTDSNCQITNNAAVLLGVIATVIISLVFYLRQNQLQSTIDGFVEAYFVRTCLQILRVILMGGDSRIQSTEENRIKYSAKMNHAIKKFHLKKLEDVKNIQNLVNNHNPIDTTHKHESCETCKDLLPKINNYLEVNKNPFD